MEYKGRPIMELNKLPAWAYHEDELDELFGSVCCEIDGVKYVYDIVKEYKDNKEAEYRKMFDVLGM